MLDLIRENNSLITIAISAIALIATIIQVTIAIQNHRRNKEDFISKKPNLSVYLENCYRLSYNSSKSINVLFCIMTVSYTHLRAHET